MGAESRAGSSAKILNNLDQYDSFLVDFKSKIMIVLFWIYKGFQE